MLLLLVLLPAAAWLSFPWFAQSLLDRTLEGKPFRVEVSGVGHPGISGIGLRSLKVVFTTPPDNCSNGATSYTLSVANATLSWDLKNRKNEKSKEFFPKFLDTTFTLKADSLTLLPDPQQFSFSDRNPRITFNMEIASNNGLIPSSIKPLSALYSIDDATVTREKLRLENVNYNIKLSAAEQWQQPEDTLYVAKLFSDGKPSPVGNFRALFGSKRDPLKPCTLLLRNCSVELLQWKATSNRIEYDLKSKQTRLSLNLAEIPLSELPGFNRGDNKKPIVTGRVSGSIPIEFQDSTLLVRNALVSASKGSSIIFYTKENKPFCSLDMGNDNGNGAVLKNLNATITLKSRNKELSALALSDLSATLLGGTITSTPFNFDSPGSRSSDMLFTLNLSNIKALDRIRLHGDFRGSLKGSVSGTIPVTIRNNCIAIRNAHLQSPGGGTITIAPPSKQQSTSERMFVPAKADADYSFSEPDLLFNRSFDGNTTISFKLKSLKRKTSSGELQLLSPTGKLSLGHNRNNPNLVSFSDFSAGLFGGTIAVDRADYDMATKETETTVNVNNIPLQTLLDLQGTKKIYATGTVKGSLPVKMHDQLFEIMKGGMNAEQSGQIIYATTPEERAAANQGLRTTYEALSNFLYVHLVSSISMTPDGNSIITIQLKGTNPDFQGGRPIEMNLNVEQNLLDLMRTLSISTNVEEIISEKALQMQKK